MQVRCGGAPEAIRHVLDRPRRQRHHRPALLPHQWEVRGLLGAGSSCLINPLFSLLRRTLTAEDRDAAMKFAMNLGCVDSVTLGFKNTAEIDEAIDRINL